MTGMSSEADGPDGYDLAVSAVAAGAGQSVAVAAQTVTELFRRHHLELVHLAVVMVGDLATAEDIVQDVFERIESAPGR